MLDEALMDINPSPEPQNWENIGHERNWFVPKPTQASIAYLIVPIKAYCIHVLQIVYYDIM